MATSGCPRSYRWRRQGFEDLRYNMAITALVEFGSTLRPENCTYRDMVEGLVPHAGDAEQGVVVAAAQEDAAVYAKEVRKVAYVPNRLLKFGGRLEAPL